MIKLFLELPSTVTFEGIVFELQLLHDANYARLFYSISYCLDDSKHKESVNDYGCFRNPINDSLEGFLYLSQGIENDLDFENVIKDCQYFLKNNNL